MLLKTKALYIISSVWLTVTLTICAHELALYLGILKQGVSTGILGNVALIFAPLSAAFIASAVAIARSVQTAIIVSLLYLLLLIWFLDGSGVWLLTQQVFAPAIAGCGVMYFVLHPQTKTESDKIL